MKTNVLLLLVTLILFSLASACTTTEGAVAAVAAVGASAVELINAVSPLLSEEQQAKLMTVATQIDGGIGATKTAVGVIADCISTLKSSTGAAFAEHAKNLQSLASTVSDAPSREEVHLTNAGYATGATLTARVLSVMKHAGSTLTRATAKPV
jgi:hypothetical protein